MKHKIIQVMKERDDRKRLTEISGWAKQHLQLDSTVISDGLSCFSAVRDAGCEHISIITGGGYQSVTKRGFAWVNTMIGNVKNAMTGTYHAINSKHLPRYLAEFFYRHNRLLTLAECLWVIRKKYLFFSEKIANQGGYVSYL